MKGIYKITNSLNEKIYIGLSRDINLRFYEHKRASSNSELQRDINKLGVEKFRFEILEEVNHISDLEERETYWIKKFREDNFILYNKKKIIKDNEYKRQTYFLTDDLIKIIGIKAVFEKKDKSQIVREAIEAYIEDKYLEMAKFN